MKVVKGLCVVVGLAMGVFSGVARAAEPAGHHPYDALQWTKTPVGAEISPVWGNPKAGAHGTIFRFPGGSAVPLHTHSAGYRGVVLTGTMVHSLPGDAGTEKPLGSGSHYFIPANAKHTSTCTSKEPCLLLVVQDAGFDLVMAGQGGAK